MSHAWDSFWAVEYQGVMAVHLPDVRNSRLGGRIGMVVVGISVKLGTAWPMDADRNGLRNDMRVESGRVLRILDLGDDPEHGPRSVLVLDRLRQVPGPGDVLALPGREVAVIGHDDARGRRWCWPWRRGEAAVIVSATAQALRPALRHGPSWVRWSVGALPGQLDWQDGGPVFTRLSTDWSADPNAPELGIETSGAQLLASMDPNRVQYPRYAEIARICLRFAECAAYRVTPINDHAWSGGGCRFSGVAPAWGAFYEISGDCRDEMEPTPWIALDGRGARHFLFYLRDETLEVKAGDWEMCVSG